MASFLLDVLDFVSSPHVEQLLFIVYIQVLTNKFFEIIGCILTLFVVEIIEYPIVVIIILHY